MLFKGRWIIFFWRLLSRYMIFYILWMITPILLTKLINIIGLQRGTINVGPMFDGHLRVCLAYVKAKNTWLVEDLLKSSQSHSFSVKDMERSTWEAINWDLNRSETKLATQHPKTLKKKNLQKERKTINGDKEAGTVHGNGESWHRVDHRLRGSSRHVLPELFLLFYGDGGRRHLRLRRSCYLPQRYSSLIIKLHFSSEYWETKSRELIAVFDAVLVFSFFFVFFFPILFILRECFGFWSDELIRVADLQPSDLFHYLLLRF